MSHQPAYTPTQTDGDDRTLAVAAHLSTIVAMVISAGWLSFVGPLVVWLLFRHRSELVRRSAAGSFNFNIWAWLMTIIGWICFFTVLGIPVAVVLWVIAGIMTLWCHIRGAMFAARGELYRYPAQLRILQ